MPVLAGGASALAQDNSGWNDLNTQSDPVFSDDGGVQTVPPPEPVYDATSPQTNDFPDNNGDGDLFGNGPGANPQGVVQDNEIETSDQPFDDPGNGNDSFNPDSGNPNSGNTGTGNTGTGNIENGGNQDNFDNANPDGETVNNGFEDGDDPFASTQDDGRDENGDIIAGPNTVIDPETGDPVTQQEDDSRVSNRIAVLNGLDKITGNITTFDVYIDETVQFGVLQVTPRVCYTSPPTQTPKTIAFLEVDEQTLDRSIRRIFTGWMFADSPGLNALEHPVYDIWLKDCKMDSDVPAPDGMAAAQSSGGEGSSGSGATEQLGPAAIPEPVDPASIPIPEPRPNIQSIGG